MRHCPLRSQDEAKDGSHREPRPTKHFEKSYCSYFSDRLLGGVIGSLSGYQGLPIQSLRSRGLHEGHGCCPLLSRTHLLAGHRHLRRPRREQRTKKRQPLCQKRREMPVIILQDYP
jgi:hypothetical protein